MSIYRLSDRLPRNDMHAPSIDDERWALTAPAAASLVQLDIGDYQHLRKATPANRIFPRTASWLASLPEDVHPPALVRRFPRIANLICAVWANPEFLNTYMESLLTDQRGNRRGFPPDVLEELVSLRGYYDAVSAQRSTAAAKRA